MNGMNGHQTSSSIPAIDVDHPEEWENSTQPLHVEFVEPQLPRVVYLGEDFTVNLRVAYPEPSEQSLEDNRDVVVWIEAFNGTGPGNEEVLINEVVSVSHNDEGGNCRFDDLHIQWLILNRWYTFGNGGQANGSNGRANGR
ncbi:hypothetical protein VTN77DRAFT_5871 [Rasamsonia byssochlamydoides]|uniref:uncharacterized protein n=1 Tax=Rasamsonia byssochlamydoides TaxID=89139 RepID=UPI0037427D9A